MSNQRWYPAQGTFNGYAGDNAVRQAFDHIYALQDRLTEMNGKHEELQRKMKGVSEQNEKLQKIINSQVAGVKVKPTLPSNADTIRFNATSQQFEFGP